jgi:hypothetical protein
LSRPAFDAGARAFSSARCNAKSLPQSLQRTPSDVIFLRELGALCGEKLFEQFLEMVSS